MKFHLLVSLVFVVSCLSSAQRFADNDEWMAARWAKLRKRQMCDSVGEKCFSTGQCCRGLVCAAFDDYFGQKPEVPGLCVKEKDLQVCTTSKECFGGSKCAPLGRTGERYCLPRSGDGLLDEKVPIRRGDGGLGSECQSDADCMETSQMDGSPLCCQNVARIRQGVKRMCDRKTPISRCISG